MLGENQAEDVSMSISLEEALAQVDPATGSDLFVQR